MKNCAFYYFSGARLVCSHLFINFLFNPKFHTKKYEIDKRPLHRDVPHTQYILFFYNLDS